MIRWEVFKVTEAEKYKLTACLLMRIILSFAEEQHWSNFPDTKSSPSSGEVDNEESAREAQKDETHKNFVGKRRQARACCKKIYIYM